LSPAALIYDLNSSLEKGEVYGFHARTSIIPVCTADSEKNTEMPTLVIHARSARQGAD
jgi:hypothetical protein